MIISKFFRVATEGATTDGRKISREQIQQMAASYTPKKYGARIWLEHLRGMLADSLFKALGDVTALEARPVEDGKLGLFAQIAPTPDLIKMNRERQKIFSSIELDPNFADTGQAYLVGLAVTDSPASLGTEILEFSAGKGGSLFASRKQNPSNLIAEAIEADLEFADQPAGDGADKPSLLEQIKGMFRRKEGSDDTRFAEMEQTILTLAAEVQRQGQAKPPAEHPEITALRSDLAELKQAHAQLLADLDKTRATPTRPAATGGNGALVTDC